MATRLQSRVPDPASSTAGGISRWWRVVGGLSMNLALGSLYAWSVFVAPLEKEFGWKRAQTSNVFTIAVVVFAISFILAGRLQDKLGPFWISITGGLLVSLGFFLCGFTSSLNYLSFCFGVLGGIGNGFGYATPIPVMAKWFPDRRGLAVGLAVAGYGGGSAIFGPLSNLYLIPHYGWRTTFEILGVIFLVMTMIGAFLLKNPPMGYRPAGWRPAPTAKAAAMTYDFSPGEVLKTSTFYFMWIGYALGTSAGLMVISQLVPFARSQGIPSDALATMGLFVGAIGNASGRILSGWMSDALGRLNVLRLMLAISAVAMPILYGVGANVPLLYIVVFAVYWCYGTLLSVNASATSDFWGTKNAGVNYGLLFTAWGVAGIIGPRIGGVLFDKYRNYQAAFYTAAVLVCVALLCEFVAKRPAPEPVPAAAGGVFAAKSRVVFGRAARYEPTGVAAPGPRPPEERAAEGAPGPPPRPIEPPPVYPSIEPSEEHVVQSHTFDISVVLRSKKPEHTVGGISLPKDLDKEHEIRVHLLLGEESCWDTLKFSYGRGTIKQARFRMKAPVLRSKADGTFLERESRERVAVNFYLNDRWCGEAERYIEILAHSKVEPLPVLDVPEAPLWRTMLHVSDEATPPDLLVRIQENRNGGFTWTLLSPHMNFKPLRPQDYETTLKDGPQRYVKAKFEPLAGRALTADDLDDLLGKCKEIYDSTPEAFKEAYWALYWKWGEEFRTIQFVSDEPYVPWEVMRVDDGVRGKGVPAEILSIRHAVGRWVATSSCQLRQTISVSEMAVFASDYKNVAGIEPKLDWAVKEREHLQQRYGARPHPLRSKEVKEFLENGTAQAIHFSCHGKMDQDSPEYSVLQLEDDLESFRPTRVDRQEVREGIGKQHPLVFLNACQLGAAAYTLSFVTGWPQTFLKIGASACVAPLWSVKDATAEEIASAFYAQALEDKPPKTLGEALQNVRKKWKARQNLTYLAYVLYGDPTATLKWPRA